MNPIERLIGRGRRKMPIAEDRFNTTAQKPEAIIPLTVSSELNETYRNLLSLCMTVIDPRYRVNSHNDLLYEEFDDSSFESKKEQLRSGVLSDWKTIKKMMSTIPGDESNPEYKHKKLLIPIKYQGELIGSNRVDLCQSSENLITLTSEQSFRIPYKHREQYSNIITFLSEDDNLKKVEIESTNIGTGAHPQKILLFNFLKRNI